MENEGIDLPIGGDFSDLAAAFESINASFEKMGQQIAAAFEKSNAAIASSIAKLAAHNAAINAAAAAQSNAGAAAMSAAGKFAQAAQTAGNLGNAFTGMHSAMKLASAASRAVAGVNLAAALTGWMNRAGGVRDAFARIPAAMSAIASNPTFRVLVVGAAAAAAGILTIRTAWRAVSAAAHSMASAARATFQGLVSAAQSAGRSIRSAFQGLASLPGKALGSMGGALPLAGMIGGIGGIAGAIGLAMASIDKAANMETLETAFAPLLGGADKAKARIAELAKVAAATPFELPEIARASRVLETLTRGALSTGIGLRMVGDVAAGTGAPFEELAMWIGRLYDGLQSGRPVGEALMRLQELGIVSGNVRGRIEALQKSGAAGPAIWAEAEAALGRFSGSMERQSQTWAGKLSTMRDSVNLLMAEFGKPIIDSLKPFLDMAIVKIESMKAAAAALGNKIRDAFDGALATWQTGNIAEVLGAGLTLAVIDGVNSFSSGIRKTVAYLGASLSSIMDSVKNSWGAQEFLGILKDLGEGLAYMITGAILKAIGHIPGINTTVDGQLATGQAKYKFSQAGNRLENIDGAAAVQGSIDALRKANEKGLAASAEAGKALLLNRGSAAAKFAGVWETVRERMEKNREEMAANMKALDDKLKNAAPDAPQGDLAAKVKKIAAPAVMSLTRIGGGGFANTVMNSLVAETKRQTGYLKTIAANTSSNSPTLKPAVYS
jgi:hypothetical protein